MAYLGDLGGLLDVLLVLGSLFCSSFVGKLLYGALIGQAYRIQRYKKDSTQLYETTEVGKLSSDSEG